MHPVLRLLALRGLAAVLGLAASVSCAAAEGAGWPYYGGTSTGTRYSAAKQIDRSNVQKLAVAWRYSTGEVKRRGAAAFVTKGCDFQVLLDALRPSSSPQAPRLTG